MTVEELLKHIKENNIDLKSKIYIERIEDVYFEKNGWKTKKKKSFDFPDSYDKYFEIFCGIKYKNDNGLYLTGHF
jgi:hypothetical protein